MTNTIPVLTEEKRQALIADCKADIALTQVYISFHGKTPELRSKVARQQIALASLEAQADHWVQNSKFGFSAEKVKPEYDPMEPSWVAGYLAPPAPALKLPDELRWSHHDNISQAECESWNNCIAETKRLSGVTE